METQNTIHCTFSELAEKIYGLTQDTLFVVSGKADCLCANNLSYSLQDIAKKGVKVSLDLKEVEFEYAETDGAFWDFTDCTSLKNINIPSGARQIYEFAFCGCVSLEKIELPEGLKKIGRQAFCGCKSLKSLTIPSSVTEIEPAAFCDCEALELKSKTSAFVAENGLLFNADKTKIISAYGNGKSVAIPDGVAEIAELAFIESKTLESVEIPKSVTKIGVKAFNWCDNLKLKLNSPNFVAEGNLLLNTDKTEILSVYGNPKSVKIPEGIAEIKDYIFSSCAELESVELPSTLKKINAGSFRDCLSLKNVSFPDGLKEISGFAFAGCESLKKIEVPASCKVAENAAFYVVNNKGILTEIVRR